MKRHRVAGNSLIPVIAVLFSLMALLVQTGAAHAAPITDCAGCHGMPPLDDATRNITTGGFQGNHQTHQPAAAVAANCGACHGAGVSGYNNAHRDGFIRLSSSINGSPATGTYTRGTSFAQSATPALGTCSNVNCHFEKVTPTWGTANFTYTDSSTNDCNKCHLAAPTDGNHPYGTQKHGVYYGTDTGSCVKCHTDHTAEANKFAHATSAGNRGLQVLFTAAPNSGFGRYTGNVSYPKYLPSRSTARNGTCQSLYCHSDGTVGIAPYASPNKRPVWGATLACNGCHKADKAVANDPMATGSHAKHVDGSFSAYNCVKCHAATVTAGMTIANTANHVTKLVNVAFNNSTTAVNGTYGGSATPITKAPGSLYATCNNVYCHSNVQPNGGVGAPTYRTPAWGGTAACGTCHDGGSGHGDATPMATGSHTRHLAYQLGTTSNAARCAICHNIGGGTINDNTNCSTGSCHSAMVSKHADHNIDVSIVGSYGGTYNGSPTPGTGYSTCINVYCHSDGKATPTYAPAAVTTWGNGALSCTSCHGSATANGAGGTALSGRHDRHANNTTTAYNGLSFGCVECHAVTVSNNTTINPVTGYTHHVDKMVDYSGVRAGNNKSCTTFYCHSNGKRGTAVAVSVTPPAWTTAAAANGLACTACHGTNTGGTSVVSVAGEPNYQNRVNPGTATANSHQAHVGAAGATTCKKCHFRTTQDGLSIVASTNEHIDGTRDVRLSKPTAFAAYSGVYNSGAMTCSATYCHGTAASPVWGSPALACDACHAASNKVGKFWNLSTAHRQHWETATLPTDFNAAAVNSGTAASYQFNCASCHKPGAAPASSAQHASGPPTAAGYAGQVFFGFTSATRKGAYVYGTVRGSTDNGFKWTNGNGCNTTYCHSNGNDGAPVNTTFTWASPNGTLDCGGCHNKAGDASWSGTAPHTKHVITYSANVNITCNSCHALTASSNSALSDKTKHVNKVKDVGFNAWAGGSGGANCTNTYCHSNGQNPASPTHGAISWNTPPVVTCTSCHGDKTTNTLSGRHDRHVNNVTTAYNGVSYGCVDCHALTVSDNTTIKSPSGYTKHVNKFIDYSGVRAGNNKSCTTFYCHSNGKMGTAVVVNVTPPAWSTAAAANGLACTACHGTNSGGTSVASVAGEPNYQNRVNPGTATANSHQAHVGAAGATTCKKCHFRTTQDGLSIVASTNEHIDGTRDVRLSKPTAFAAYSGVYNSGAMTCSATYCHGAAASPAWGSPALVCDACHSASNKVNKFWNLSTAHRQHWETATLPTDFNAAPVNSGTAASYQFNCASCHKPGATPATSAQHASGPPTAAGYAGQVFFGFTSATRKGAYVYGTVRGSTDNGFKWTNGNGCNTTYCHSNGNDGAPVNTTFTWASANGTLDCGGCHNKAGDASWSGTAGHTKHIIANNAAGIYTCDTCHNLTATNNTTLANKTYHVNKVKDVAGTLITSAYVSGGSCTAACHGRTAPKWSDPPSTGCNFCHPYAAADWVSPTWTGKQISATSEGFGAHQKHINYIITRWSLPALNPVTDRFGTGNAAAVCGVCHTNILANHIGVATMQRTISFGESTARKFGPNPPAYNGTSATSSATLPKTCANLDCHYKQTPVWSSY